MTADLEIVDFGSTDELWTWLAENSQDHPGVWVRLQRAGSTQPSVAFEDLLEAGIAFGWSESTRRAHDRAKH